MSVHFEWAGIEDCPINIVGANFDVHEWDYVSDGNSVDQITNGPAIIMGGDSAFVVEGDRPDQLVEFARTLLRMVEAEFGRKCPSCETVLDKDGYCTDVACPQLGKVSG